MARKLQDHHVNKLGKSRLKCRSLKCKCISLQADFEHAHLKQSSGNNQGFSTMEKQKENDVSNVCLTILKFLMLDGQTNRDENLNSLFTESLKFLNKERGPDETMIEVMYPVYVELF